MKIWVSLWLVAIALAVGAWTTYAQNPQAPAPLPAGGSLNGLSQTVDAALKLDWDVTPGPAPRINRTGFVRWRKDTEALRRRQTSRVREGSPKIEVQYVLVNEFRRATTGAPIRPIDGMIAQLRQ